MHVDSSHVTSHGDRQHSATCVPTRQTTPAMAESSHVSYSPCDILVSVSAIFPIAVAKLARCVTIGKC